MYQPDLKMIPFSGSTLGQQAVSGYSAFSDNSSRLKSGDVYSRDLNTIADYDGSTWFERQFNGTGVAQEEQRYNNALDRLYNASEAEKSRQFNAEQAQLQRDFEERMSNTAYSRAAQDLKSIGINPYVLVSGFNSSSTPSGAAASGYSASHSGSSSGARSKLSETALNAFAKVAAAYIAAVL